MIIESDHGNPSTRRDDHPNDHQGPLASLEFVDFFAMHQEIREEVVHHKLKNNLIKHVGAKETLLECCDLYNLFLFLSYCNYCRTITENICVVVLFQIPKDGSKPYWGTN
jgi:hypothetical protein